MNKSHEKLPLIISGGSVASAKHPERNEDAFFVDEKSNSAGVFDGVSGCQGSELASEIAATVILKKVASFPNRLSKADSHSLLKDALMKAHKEILKSAAGKVVATSATVAKICKDQKSTILFAVIANVGDSRAYLFRENNLTHLTLDHSIIFNDKNQTKNKQLQEKFSEITSLDQLSKDEQEAFQKKGYIYEVLGGKYDYHPRISLMDVELQNNDKIIIATDGIHDNLTNSEIAETIKDNLNITSLPGELIGAATKRSKNNEHIRAKADDMTAAVIQV
ncbi:serine/threonine-protein phosphatase [bacterium]|nr:serine/threonine-protein phosphatase [bacterium]